MQTINGLKIKISITVRGDSRESSIIIYDASGERGFAQTGRIPSYGGVRIWPNRHNNFHSGGKSLIHIFS